ncbi:hypothetical protein [Pseudomonas phage vB_PaeP_TUMS_P10]|nr:hypothetical protein [Pseudomonas phage vB_PaeP_TUMS_P10]
MTTFSLDNQLFLIRVMPTKGKLEGYRICLTLIKGKERQMLIHEQMFGRREDAMHVRSLITARRVLNLDHWVWAAKSNFFGDELAHKPTARFRTKPIYLSF